jgi:hypothetical protein
MLESTNNDTWRHTDLGGKLTHVQIAEREGCEDSLKRVAGD